MMYLTLSLFFASWHHVYTCSRLLMCICIPVIMHTHPIALTHAYSFVCRTPRPAQLELCLAPVLHPSLSLLISSQPRKSNRRQHQQCSALAWPACLSYFQPPPALRMQARAGRKKAEGPDSYLLLSSGLCPLWLRKKSSRGV